MDLMTYRDQLGIQPEARFQAGLFGALIVRLIPVYEN